MDFNSAALIEEELREKSQSKHANALPERSRSKIGGKANLKTLSPFTISSSKLRKVSQKPFPYCKEVESSLRKDSLSLHEVNASR